MPFMKFFQVLWRYDMDEAFVQTEYYQSHQLVGDLDTYRRRYSLLFKMARKPNTSKLQYFQRR
eukprot:UN06719